MSANDYIKDRATRHNVFVQRFAGGEVKRLQPLLANMSEDINRRLLLAGDAMTLQRLEVLLAEVNGVIAEAAESMQSQLLLSLGEFAEYEAGFTARLMEQASVSQWIVPAAEEIAAAVSTSSMELVAGKTVKRITVDSMVADFATANQAQISQAIRAGFIEGQTGQEVAKTVQALTDTRTRAQAEAFVRTSTNHMASEARKLVMDANSELILHEEWVSVLDGRTTLICGSLDGRVFPVGDGIYPPAHFGCRSDRIAVLKPVFAKKGLDGDRKTEKGEVHAKSTYGGWLRKQPKEFQNEALGAERAELFRNKGLSIDKFTDERGRAYSLNELKLLEPLAFA